MFLLFQGGIFRFQPFVFRGVFFYFWFYLGKWSNLTHIFQTGWNHHLVTVVLQKFSASPWKEAMPSKNCWTALGTTADFLRSLELQWTPKWWVFIGTNLPNFGLKIQVVTELACCFYAKKMVDEDVWRIPCYNWGGFKPWWNVPSDLQLMKTPGQNSWYHV